MALLALQRPSGACCGPQRGAQHSVNHALVFTASTSSRPAQLRCNRQSPVCTAAAGVGLQSAALPAAAHALEAVPQISESYALGQQIGRGSFAVVLEVTDKRTGERFCAKKLPKFLHTKLPCQQRQVVASEAETQRALCAASSSILRLHGVCQDGSYYYIISELCQTDLARYLSGRKMLSEREAAHITQQLLTALLTCHRHGVAYRDVKPANLLVRRIDANGLPEICLADFGCSRSTLGPQPSNRSSPGTPLFSAPECVHGCGGVESDVWSVGVLLYNLLSDAYPFCDPRQKISQSEYYWRVAEAKISYSGPGWHGVSPRAVELVRRMLDRDCSSRITAQEALQDPWLQDLTSSGVASSSWRTGAQSPASERTMANVVPGLPEGMHAALRAMV